MHDKTFEAAIKEFEASGFSVEAAAAADFCTVYKKVEPIIKGILPFLKLIPVWGATAAAAIEAFLAALDKLCP